MDERLVFEVDTFSELFVLLTNKMKITMTAKLLSLIYLLRKHLRNVNQNVLFIVPHLSAPVITAGAKLEAFTGEMGRLREMLNLSLLH